jgi:hypothetical protein
MVRYSGGLPELPKVWRQTHNRTCRFLLHRLGEMEEAVVHLDESDATAIREALSPIIHRTASELRNLSHLPQSAWSRVWWYEGHTNPGMEISPAILLGVANGGNVGEA